MTVAYKNKDTFKRTDGKTKDKHARKKNVETERLHIAASEAPVMAMTDAYTTFTPGRDRVKEVKEKKTPS